MTHEVGKRIIRPATQDEKERHDLIRRQIAEEIPELKEWARRVAAQHQERVRIGTVLTSEEAPILEAMDDYALKHALSSRSAVIREALARLLDIEIARR
jgi:hypothetical protein